MFTPSQPQTFTPSPGFDGEIFHFGLRHDPHAFEYFQANVPAEFSMPNDRMYENHLLIPPVGEPRTLENVPFLSDAQDTCHANRLMTDGAHVPSSAHGAPPLSSIAICDSSYVTPAHSSYNLGWHYASLDNCLGFIAPGTSALTGCPIPNGQIASGAEPRDPGQIGITHGFIHSPELPAYRPNCQLVHQHGTDTNLPIFQFVPQHWPFGPSMPYWMTHPTLTTNLSTDFRPFLPGHHSLCQDHTGRSRHKRRARTIEFNGLLIDEEDLLQGVTEPDGRITVFQCRWEGDYSPCHLWVKGDKSCINMHIQKWHGGKPGGEKLEANCRWSGCGQTMLKESMSRHLISVHLGELWECQGCRKRVARKDTYVQHSTKSALPACRNSGAVITYEVDAREIDVRAVLNGRGIFQHAGNTREL